MKKLLLTTAFFAFLMMGLQAQDGKKLLKEAGKVFDKLMLDPASNPGSLQEGESLLAQAFEDTNISSEGKYWIEKGKIYSNLASEQIKSKILNPSATLYAPNAALEAFKAYAKAFEISGKKGDQKKALEGISGSETDLSNFGIEQYKLQDYNGAFENFAASLEANKLLKANDQASILEDPVAYEERVYFTSVCAYYSDDRSQSKAYFEELLSLGSKETIIFEGLYSLYIDSDEEKALGYLQQGRELNPDDSGLLFSEINYYLKQDKLVLLIDKLKLAMEKEPDNLSVINTLGNVYDRLHQKANESGDAAKSQEYFDTAMGYYNEILSKEATNFDANYSIGALYYNKAASYTGALNELGNDFSPAGTKKYDKLKAEMDSFFDKALPYFIKAESIDGKDKNTMIALKEIYARKNDMTKVDEYKMKMDSME